MKLARESKQRVRIDRVLQKGKYEYHQVCWSYGGKENRRSFVDRSEAETYAESVMDAVEQGSPEIVLANPRAVEIFSMLYHRLGDERLLEVLQAEMARTMAAISIREAATEYLKSLKDSRTSIRHQYTVKSNLERFLGVMKKPMHLVTKHDIDDYLSQFENPKTRSNHRITLRAFFTYAQRKGWVAQRATAVELSEIVKVPTTEPVIYTPDEMEKLLAHADELSKVHLVVGGFCGARSAEIQRLRWEDVREDSLIFPTRVTKTKMRRVCALEPNAQAWLRLMRRGDKDPLTWTETTLNEKLREIHKSAGVVRKQNGLRHSYVSYHMEVYDNASLTAKHCGHSIAQLQRSYMQITDDKTARDWFRIFPAAATTPPSPSTGLTTETPCHAN